MSGNAFGRRLLHNAMRCVLWALCAVVIGGALAGCEQAGAQGEAQPEAAQAEGVAEIARLVVSRHEGEANGWELLTEAARLCNEIDRESLRNWGGDRDTELSPGLVLMDITRGAFPPGGPRKGLELGLELLAKMEEAEVFEKLRAFSAVGRAWRPVDEWGDDAKTLHAHMRETSAWRNLVRTSRARMRLAAARGDGAEATRILEDLLAIAAAHGDQLLLLDRLSGIATLSVAAGETRFLLVDGVLDGATCARMLEAFDGRRRFPAFEATLQAESQFQVVMAAQVNGWLARTSAAERKESADALRAVLARPEVMAVKAAAEDLSPPLGEALDGGPAMLEREDLVEHLAELVAKAVVKVQSSEVEVQMAVEGTRIMLALEVYRGEHGTYPEGLEALAGGVIGEVPADPLSGEAFVYRLLKDDEVGRGYLLYSVGADGVDDGGREHEEVREKAWSESGKGFDYVVNSPRYPAIDRGDLQW